MPALNELQKASFGNHRHSYTDIVNPNDGVVLDPNASGGSISVTDGTTTVDPATSLRLPAGTLSDLGGGEGGVGLVFQLFGPFTIRFDDVDIGNGIGLLDLSAGQLVFASWANIKTAFDNVAHNPAFVAMAVGDPAGENWNIGYYFANLSGVQSAVTISATVNEGSMPGDIVGNLPHPALIRTTTKLVAWIDGGTFTSGEADLYAIIATPAA